MSVLENVLRQGYCCIFGYMTANATKTTKEMAEELYLHPRTIRLYKAQLRDGRQTCLNRTSCRFLISESPQKLSCHPEVPEVPKAPQTNGQSVAEPPEHDPE